MGCFKMLSGGSDSASYREAVPSKFNYKIKECYYFDGYTVVEINYPDCINYEGNKILVYLGDKVNEINSMDNVDPHFLENGLSPIARFNPSEEGKEFMMTALGL